MGIDEIRKQVYVLSLSQQVDEIIDGATSDREKALRLAKWVGTHWRNASTIELVNKSHTSKVDFTKWVNRTGACASRVTFFVNMAEIAGLRVQRFSIYNFGKVGSGHSAAQVFWDDEWHYFDVTYSGYFLKDNDILSYEEMLTETDNLLDYLVPFPDFGEYYGNRWKPKTWRAVNNKERMSRIYQPKYMRAGTSYGVVGSSDTVTLHYTLSPGIELGKLDSKHQDVKKDGVVFGISEQLGTLGFDPVPFFHDISVVKIELNTSYTLRYDISRKIIPKDALFEATSSNCTVTQGNKFVPATDADYWSINFIATTEPQCNLFISHNLRSKKQLVFIDKISLFPT